MSYFVILCVWFRASLICINICPTKCNTKQAYLLFCKFTLHVSGATSIIRSTQNCNYSLQYWSYFFVQLLPSNLVKLACSATLEGGRSTPITRSTQNCNYSLRYYAAIFLQLAKLGQLEEDSCIVPEAVVTVLCTPGDGCGSTSLQRGRAS